MRKWWFLPLSEPVQHVQHPLSSSPPSAPGIKVNNHYKILTFYIFISVYLVWLEYPFNNNKLKINELLWESGNKINTQNSVVYQDSCFFFFWILTITMHCMWRERTTNYKKKKKNCKITCKTQKYLYKRQQKHEKEKLILCIPCRFWFRNFTWL